MSDISNIVRALKIRDIILRYTDENNELSISQIIEKLKYEFGTDFTISRNTVRRIIEDLRTGKFDIIESQKDGVTFYSHPFKSFELHELRVLIDAVSSAKFITEDETQHLIKKIKSLTSESIAISLQNQISVASRIKAENKLVRYNIDKIHNAIAGRYKLAFQYGSYNVNKEFVLRHYGKIYSVIPLGLVWNSDYYYLIAKQEDEDKVKHYRVDRLVRVEITSDSFIFSRFNLSAHLETSFNMYPGEVEYVEIHFNNELINAVIDFLGRKVHIRIIDDQMFAIKMKAAINEGLIRWILSWGSHARVIYPIKVVDALNQEIAKMNKVYSEGI